MTTHQIEHLGWLAVDDLDMHAGDRPCPIALCQPGQSATAAAAACTVAVAGDPDTREPAPAIKQGGSLVACAIGRHRWRRLGMPTVFELGHQVVCNLLLGLANRRSTPQPRIHIPGYAAPEGARFVGFSLAPFSPLVPT